MQDRITDNTFKYGVYGYVDVSDGSVVYIGIDSNFKRNTRHLNHMKPSKGLNMASDNPNKAQVINIELQSNPDKYIYIVLAQFNEAMEEEAKDLMYMMETHLINKHKPKYNVKMKTK